MSLFAYICMAMRFRIHTDGAKVSEAFTSYVQDRLERLYQDFGFIIEGEVNFKELGNKGPHRGVELHLRVPGEVLHVSERAEDFQTAFDSGLSAMRRSLQRYKEQIRS